MAPQPHLGATLVLQQAVFSKKADRPGKADRARASPVAPGREIRLALKLLQWEAVSSELARTACGAVQDLLQTDQDCRAALDADAVPILTATLLRHGAAPAVMLNGLSALLLLATHDRAQSQLLRNDILPPLISAVRQHKSLVDVMILMLAILVQLPTNQKSRLVLFTSHAVEMAIEVMLAHPNSVDLQCLGCELLRHLVDGSLGQQQLLELGAVETLAEAVRRFPLERRLQQRALPALCRLCEAEGVRTAIWRVGVVPAILQAMDCNYDDVLVARYGCTLLWELTLCSTVHQQFVPAEVKVLVKKILNYHAQDDVMLMHGRALLWRIAGRPRKVRRHSAGCGAPQPSTRTQDTAP